MKIVTFNVNGFRSATSKGLQEWILQTNPDIICLQEVKAELNQVNLESLSEFEVFWNPAQKKGYSGVATLSKVKPKSFHTTLGYDFFDQEGRFMLTEFADFALLNVYIPSGTSGDVRQDAKYKFLDFFYQKLTELSKKYSKLLICGDFNICHKEIDIHNPKSNKNSSGFLPEEREWMSKLFDSGFVDVFRLFNPNPNQYTWFSQRSSARKENKGWRIDYFVANFFDAIKLCEIDNQANFSDHLPVFIEIEFNK
jgi:exodeoxyribonuclease-3